MHSKVKIARIGGLLYLLIIIFGLIAQIFVRDSLVDYNNATITAKNILTSESWYRFGFVSELFMLLCDIGVTTILWILLMDTNRNLCILSTLLRFASIIILSVVALTHFAALAFLKDADFLTVFNKDQLNALALLTVKMHGAGYNISLLFFGFHLLVLGRLIHLSGIFPKLLGVLLTVGGICYILNSFIWFLFPAFINVVYPAILIPCALGEWIFCFYLLIKGCRQVQLNTQPNSNNQSVS